MSFIFLDEDENKKEEEDISLAHDFAEAFKRGVEKGKEEQQTEEDKKKEEKDDSNWM